MTYRIAQCVFCKHLNHDIINCDPYYLQGVPDDIFHNIERCDKIEYTDEESKNNMEKVFKEIDLDRFLDDKFNDSCDLDFLKFIDSYNNYYSIYDVLILNDKEDWDFVLSCLFMELEDVSFDLSNARSARDILKEHKLKRDEKDSILYEDFGNGCDVTSLSSNLKTNKCQSGKVHYCYNDEKTLKDYISLREIMKELKQNDPERYNEIESNVKNRINKLEKDSHREPKDDID